jgi:hypothetical protein
MKRSGLVLAIVLASALTPSAQTRTAPTCVQGSPHSAVLTSVSFEAAVAAQDRINRYLHRDVVPAMRDCWGRLAGPGSVSVRLRYERADDRWVPGASAVRGATLAAGEAELALQCLQAAVAGTGFAAEAVDREASSYVVNWTFPVPWPTDEEVLRLAVDNGGGGGGSGQCGGPEHPPACTDCGYIPILGWSFCMPSCVGYLSCNKIPNGCHFPDATRCITGGVFRNLSGIALYPSR